jgi:hypothetical protein
VPFIPVLKCDGPECPQETIAQADPQRGWRADGWQFYDSRTFCGHLCVARHAAQAAQREQEALAGALDGQVDDLRSGAARESGHAP